MEEQQKITKQDAVVKVDNDEDALLKQLISKEIKEKIKQKIKSNDPTFMKTLKYLLQEDESNKKEENKWEKIS